MARQKRRLTKEEVAQIREWMEKAAIDRKPTIRQIAKAFGVNQPSVVKSLEGWKGIHRGRPDIIKEQKVIDQNIAGPVVIEPAEFGVKNELNR